MRPPTGLPRLLTGVDGRGPLTLIEHEHMHGPLPNLASQRLIEMVERSGLRGRGGADFPTAVKLRAVASRRRAAAVVVNGSETEPASGKDTLLLSAVPHLVLDGAQLAAAAVGAEQVIVKVDEGNVDAIETVTNAITQRRRSGDRFPVELVVGPDGYVTGEESAVVQLLNRGVAKPTFVPPRPFEKGYRGRPTLIQNVETLAQIALIARHGPDWYRQLGTSADPGTALVTITGAVRAPGVYELAFGTPMTDLLAAAGDVSEPLQAVLVGGYFGTWVGAGRAMGLELAREQLRAAGTALGAGVIIALGENACGLHESARITRYLAGQSAGQCGPCVHGLAAIGDGMAALARGNASAGTRDAVLRWCSEVKGRGACHHPGGVARFVESSLGVFGHEIAKHRGGRCGRRPVGLPLPRGMDRRAVA
jgi:NADH:ubiquinone oxidoreductase subunit F (NADH-binding)